MITERRGNILDVREGFIAVLTNTHGEMEYGLARQVRKKFMTLESYMTMRKQCEDTLVTYPLHALLGHYFLRENPNGQDPIVAPMIALGETVNGKDHLLESDMKKALTGLREMAEKVGFRISIPGFLGCGIHGGDWERIYSKVLVPLFGESPVQLDIIYNDASVDRLDKAAYDIPCDRTGCIMEGWHGFPRTTQWEKIRQWLNTFSNSNMPFGEVRTSGRPDKERFSPEEQKREAEMPSPEDSGDPYKLRKKLMKIIADRLKNDLHEAGFRCNGYNWDANSIAFTVEGSKSIFILSLDEDS